jgi:hypothetical protein
MRANDTQFLLLVFLRLYVAISFYFCLIFCYRFAVTLLLCSSSEVLFTRTTATTFHQVPHSNALYGPTWPMISFPIADTAGCAKVMWSLYLDLPSAHPISTP